MRYAIKRFVLFSATLIVFGLVGLSTSLVAATTASQLVELARAGLDDDILISLIQTDGSTFQLSADDLLALHRQGLSNRVLRAMQDTVKPPPAIVTANAPVALVESRVKFSPLIESRVQPIDATDAIDGIDAMEQEPIVAPVAPAVVNVYETTPRVEPASGAPAAMAIMAVPIFVPVNVPSPAISRPAAPVAPVYWGWGGQRRPDSWNDGAAPKESSDQKDSKPSNAAKTNSSDNK